MLAVAVIGMTVPVRRDDDANEEGTKQYKTRRRGFRAREDLGLPPAEELTKLVESYLAYARELWPALTEQRLVPEPSETAIAELTAQFIERHRTGVVTKESLQRYQDAGLTLAIDYSRYSHEGSDPKSVWDQLRLALDRAKADGAFIPWELFLADYARSATLGHRQGFQSLLSVLRNRDLGVKLVYIDDFHRGSRNDKDWWTLASICKKLDVRLFGVSDGFSLEGEDWDVKLSFYNIISRMETKYKRQRVRRGMVGAARDNKPLGRPPFGYAHVPMRDEKGEIVFKANRHPRTVRVFDPVQKELALRIWKMFCEDKLSTYRIARVLNEEQVDGWNGWAESVVRRILLNPAYIGLFIWNRNPTIVDPETGKAKKTPAPWQQWERSYDPKLALVPKKWHVYARNKLEKHKQSKHPRKRNRFAVTLFSGLLVCGSCGRSINLYRSGKCKSMACAEGMQGRRDCKLKSCKSVRIVESSLLRFIRDHLFTKERLETLLRRCNEELARAAAQPKTDLAPLKKRVEKLQREVSRLMDRVTSIEDDGVCKAYNEKIAEHQRALSEARRQLAEADRGNAPPPAPLDLAQVETYLADLRTLLNRETPAAAEAIREFVGEIIITDKPYGNGKRGAQWFAEFSPDFLRLLGTEAQRRGYPDSTTLGFLSCSKWIPAEPVTAELKGLEFSDSKMSEQAYNALHTLLRNQPQLTNAVIAQLAGCGATTVARYRKRLAGQEPQ